MIEVAQTLGTTPERLSLIRGLIGYRQALATAGIVSGLQWIDGSFCEDVERLRSRPPGDIDVVTLFIRPAVHSGPADWQNFFNANQILFDTNLAKPVYHCDIYTVDLSTGGHGIIQQLTYWFGLFTHQRSTFLWKGVLEVELSATQDADALQYINGLNAGP